MWGWIAYITTLFILGSIGNGANMFLQQDAFVNHRNYPGGPGEFEIEQYALTYNAVCTVVYFIGAWFADGLLVCAVKNDTDDDCDAENFCFAQIYRFYTILGRTWWIMILPVAVYLTSISATSGLT